MFIAALCGAAAWTADVNISSRRGAWGNRVPPRPCPQEGLRGAALEQEQGETGFPHIYRYGTSTPFRAITSRYQCAERFQMRRPVA